MRRQRRGERPPQRVCTRLYPAQTAYLKLAKGMASGPLGGKLGVRTVGKEGTRGMPIVLLIASPCLVGRAEPVSVAELPDGSPSPSISRSSVSRNT